MIDTRQFTQAALAVFTEADHFAVKLGHLYVDTHHFLFALARVPSLVADRLQAEGVNTKVLRTTIVQITPSGSGRLLSGKMPLADDAELMVARACQLVESGGPNKTD